jgi:hypothetical protein
MLCTPGKPERNKGPRRQKRPSLIAIVRQSLGDVRFAPDSGPTADCIVANNGLMQ